jgi:hypothetical protein
MDRMVAFGDGQRAIAFRGECAAPLKAIRGGLAGRSVPQCRATLTLCWETKTPVDMEADLPEDETEVVEDSLAVYLTG